MNGQRRHSSAVRDRPTSMAVMNLANGLQVHPAIIAVKVRYERQNHRLLSQFVGTGEVRRHEISTSAVLQRGDTHGAKLLAVLHDRCTARPF